MRRCSDLWVCTTPLDFLRQLGLKTEYRIVRRPRLKVGYIDSTVTLDIETTNTTDDGFLYSIQMCMDGICVVVRYVEDLITILDGLVENLVLTPERRLVIYVHNLGYEYMYLGQILMQEYGLDEMLLTKSRKPLYIRLKNGLEFRDSLKLFQKSLARATKGLPHEKRSGDLEYKVYRTPDRPITPDEFSYMVYDVRGLWEAILQLKWQHGYNAATIPLTNTAMVIEEVNKYCRKDGKTMDAMKSLRLTKNQMRLAYHCMSGGDTPGCRWKAGWVYENCNSYDLKSAHPSQQLLKKFPAGEPITMPDDTDEETLKGLIDMEYGWIAKVFVSDFAIRPECPDPTISLSKCAETQGIYGMDNGRVLGAEGAIIYMDSNDYQRFRDAYEYGELIAIECVAFRLEYLPKQYRLAILEKFKLKEGAEDGPERNFSKVCVNTIFGASAQKVVRDEYSLTDSGLLDAEHIDWVTNLEGMNEKNVKKKQTHKFPFLWGLWTASLSRLALWDLLREVGWEKVIYWDTDSCKYQGRKIPEVDCCYNLAVRTMCVNRGAVVTNRKGEKVYIGSAEDEYPAVPYGYQRFIFLHAKCYAAESWNDMKKCYEIESTIAGVGKAEGRAALNGDISNLKDGLYIPVAGGLKLKYHDIPIYTRTDFKRPTRAASWIEMTDRDYRVAAKITDISLFEQENIVY